MIEILVDRNLGFEISPINRVIERVVTKTVKELSNTEERDSYYLSVFLTNNSEIAKINKKYSKKNKATNVLSFPQDVEIKVNKKGTATLLGDIVLSLEMIMVESEKQNKTFENHLSHMVLHGLLHLYGFTHNNSDDWKKMDRLEREILLKLSITNPKIEENA